MISTLANDRNKTDRRPQWNALIALVLILGAVAGIGIALYKPTGVNAIDWRMLGMTIRIGDGFTMGRVAFGMTPAMVRRLHPDHSAGADAYGRTVMTFAHDGGEYTVWFMDQAHRQQAFRIRFRRTVTDASEEQILATLGKRFGRPATGQCETQLSTAARDCFYTWRIASVDVAALVQAPPPVGPDGAVGLRVTAEDVVLASQLEKTPPHT